MSKYNMSWRIGDIVAELPAASEVFKQYRIDFCCGGNRPLSEAVKELKLNESELLEQLDKAYEEAEKSKAQHDFPNMSRSDLIDYIVNTHHVFVKRILPELSELTTKILRVHGLKHEELYKVHKLFHNLKTELDAHLIKEEELLFPLIKSYDQNPSKELLDKIISVMNETETEHEGAGDILKELRRITEDYTVPQDVCNTFLMTYEKLQELEADLFQHIHLENNILFRQLDTLS